MVFWVEKFALLQKKSQKKLKSGGNRGFHDSMKYFLYISQFFALFPLNGVLNSNYNKMFFSWCSFKMFYNLMYLCSAFIESILIAHYLSETSGPLDIKELNDVMFYSRGSLTCLVFLKLARNWPSLMKEFEGIEVRLQTFPPSKFLHRKLKIITFGIFFAAAVEHFSSQIVLLMKSYNCEKTFAATLRRLLMNISYWKLFKYVPYSAILGLIFQVMNTITTFGWTFIDVFIVHVSINFSENIIQLNKQVCSTVQKQVSSTSTWRALRDNYTQLLNLFGNLNDKLNDIILVSFTSNIYFLLTQMFSWMRSNLNEGSALQYVYFIFTTSLLILRTSFVCHYGATIQVESQNLLNSLATVPSYLYNEELERFIVEVNTCPMILSGRKYFFITRSLILKIAGAIVTYELVMIQFSDHIFMANDTYVCD